MGKKGDNNMELIPLDPIAQRILLIRGHRVMLDSDLAELYEVTTKRLNEQVRRNIKRFPPDFMFQLTPEEFTSLRSQNATLKIGRGHHRKYLPYAFTEQGVAMLSGVLNSERAIDVNVAIMRAFVKLREFAMTHKELSRKLNAMEKKYDTQFKVVFDAIRLLSSLHESLFAEQQSSQPSEIFGLLQRLSRVLGSYPLHGNFNKMGRVKLFLRFHYLKPSFNRLFDIVKGLFVSFALRKAAGKRRNLSNIIACLILFNYYMQFHIISLVKVRIYRKIYHEMDCFVKHVEKGNVDTEVVK